MTANPSKNDFPKVSISKGTDAADRTVKALDLIGGIAALISKGDRVFVKPNLVYPEGPPKTTDIRTVSTLVRLAKDAGAKHVLVGDSPSSASRRVLKISSRDVFEKVGLESAVTEAGGEVVVLDEDEVVNVSIPNAVICKRVNVFRSIAEADKIVSVPVMKTHFLTDVTLGVKNLYGILSYEDRKRHHRDDIHQKLADLCSRFLPALTVIDAGIGMEGFGPKNGTPVAMNLTIAGEDPLAVDAIGAALMGMDARYIDHLRILAAAGSGTIDINRIDLTGEPLEECRREFARPDLRIGGVWPNVTAIEGGVCRECRARTRWGIDMLESSRLLCKISHLTVLVGVRPYIPSVEEIPGILLVVGDCAVEAAGGLLRKYAECGSIVINGCPADAAAMVIPESVKDLLGHMGIQ